MKKYIVVSITVLLSIISCKTENKKQVKKESKTMVEGATIVTEVAMKNADTYILKQLWEVDGFSMPESVLATPNSDYIYVSNVNGSNPGFISRLTKDGKVDNMKWVDGLDSPTGLALYENLLYTGSNTRVDIIDVNNGKLIRSITSKEAKTLNDVTISKDGKVYVSDVLGGKIFTIENNKLVKWFEASEVKHPNGIYINGDAMIVVDFAGGLKPDFSPNDYGSVYKINMTDKSFKLLKNGEKVGGLDGVEKFNNGYLVSSFPNGELFSIREDGRSLVASLPKSIADIGIKGNTLFAPYLLNNKIIAYDLVPEKWTRLKTKEDYLRYGADNYYGEAGGMSVATSDGKIKGKFAGLELSGTWEWKDTYFCRTSSLGEMDLGYNCIAIDVTNTKMRLTLDKGEGPQVVYVKKNKK